MAIIDLASSRSFWRGYSYYENKRVKSFKIIDENNISGVVKGNQIEDYDVELHLDKPRTSTCTCPYSKDHPKSICKHMVALYFTAFPSEAKRVIQEIQDEEKQERDALMESIVRYVNSMSEEEVRKELIDRMFNENYEDYDDSYWGY